MLYLIKKHLADFSASRWGEFQASLAPDVLYEELATRLHVVGPDAYAKAAQRWKCAFPDLKATVASAVLSVDKAAVEVEWEGTHSGPLARPFGPIPATNRRGRVNAVMLFTVKSGKIIGSRHYFDLLTVLIQIGAAPLATVAQPLARTGTHPILR